MSYFEAIVLGIVQGLTEFLPISSSGHLRIVPELFGWSDPGASFTAVIQLGTMAAVVIFFWNDLWRITWAWCQDAWRIVKDRSTKGERSSDDARMGWYLIVATIPIAIFGFAFKDQIETGARDLRLIASTLIIGGLVLLWADRVGSRTKGVEHISTRDGVTIGLADQPFGRAVAVHLGGVDQRHAEVEPQPQRIRLLGGTARPLAHPPRPLPDGRNLRPVRQGNLAHQPAAFSAMRSTRMKFPPHSAAIWLAPYPRRTSSAVMFPLSLASRQPVNPPPPSKSELIPT